MTKEYGKDAEEWLDNTMNYFLTTYDIDIFQHHFSTGITEMPRSETKVRPDSFVMNYSQTLEFEVDTIVEKGGRNWAPPSNCPAKKRALVIYGSDGDKSTWDTPLFDTTSIIIEGKTPTTVQENGDKTDIDEGTSGDNNNDSITKLMDDLSFLKNNFQQAINEDNAKREVSNNGMVNRLEIVQSKSNAILAEFLIFINSTFTVQDRVITSLKEGKEALDEKMDKISDQVQTQMQLMTSLLTEFKTTMIGVAAAHP